MRPILLLVLLLSGCSFEVAPVTLPAVPLDGGSDAAMASDGALPDGGGGVPD